MTNWKELLLDAFKETGDTLDAIETTLSEEEMERTFSSGFGGSEGLPFTAWSDGYVYFPVVYDGAEWVGFVPRNPCNKATRHWGGE